MKETDRELWTQLFQDKLIPSTALEHFQTQLMAKIMANPVDFREDKRIAERRKCGIGLVVSLMVAVLAFGVFLWFESNMIFQGLNVVLVLLSGLTFVSNLQQIGHRVVENLLLFRELEIGLSLLWGIVSWPLLGMLSGLVIFRSTNQVHNQKPSI